MVTIYKLQFFFLVFCPLQTLIAQYASSSLSTLELGVSAGVHVYQGDLTPLNAGSIKTIKPGIMATASVYLTRGVALQLGLTMAKLSGNESRYANSQAYRAFRNFSFTSTVKEAQIVARLNSTQSVYRATKVEPFVTAGIGLSLIHVKRSWENTQFAFSPAELPLQIAEDGSYNNPAVIFIVPVGAGISLHVGNNVSLQLEGIYRLGFSDYLDGFSKAANNTKNDHYYSLNTGIRIGVPGKALRNARRKLKCRVPLFF